MPPGDACAIDACEERRLSGAALREAVYIEGCIESLDGMGPFRDGLHRRDPGLIAP